MAAKRKNASGSGPKKQAKTAAKNAPETVGEKVDHENVCQPAELNVAYAAKLEAAKQTTFAHEVFSDMKQVICRNNVQRF